MIGNPYSGKFALLSKLHIDYDYDNDRSFFFSETGKHGKFVIIYKDKHKNIITDKICADETCVISVIGDDGMKL